MKRFLAPILLFPSLALGETMRELVNRDGLHYKRFTDVPFMGEVTGRYHQGSIKNGKKDGPWVHYWGNGQLLSKETYKDGKKRSLGRLPRQQTVMVQRNLQGR
jgi:hypothetical protein